MPYPIWISAETLAQAQARGMTEFVDETGGFAMFLVFGVVRRLYPYVRCTRGLLTDPASAAAARTLAACFLEEGNAVDALNALTSLDARDDVSTT